MFIALKNINTGEEFSYEDFDLVIYPSDEDQAGPILTEIYLPDLVDVQVLSYIEEHWKG